MRIRAAFAKQDAAKFIGHLDLTKVFERAMRRAELPMAFSEGFNPHPKMSFGSALALGATSVREYVDIDLAEEMPPQEFGTRLTEQLPPGIALLEVKEIPMYTKALMAVLNCTCYQIKVPLLLPLTQAKFTEVLQRFVGQDSIPYVRYAKNKGRQDKDLKPYLRKLSGQVSAEWLELELEVVLGNQGSVKPVEVVAVLREFGDLPLDVDGIRVHRNGIFICDGQGMKSPMDL